MSYKEYRAKRLQDSRRAYAALMKFYPLTLEDLEGEEWREIWGTHMISNFGRLKSLVRVKPHICKPTILHHYLVFDVRTSHNRQRYTSHRLVAQAFIPNPDGKPQVNHIDGIKFNNHVSNLEWVTQSENIQHSLITHLKKSGEDNYLSMLSNEQAAWIRSVYKPYDKIFGAIPLARLLGVSEATIRAVVSGQHYKFL